MTLLQLTLFSALVLVVPWVFKEPGRRWLIFIGSVLAVYWLQPSTSIRYLDFWLPTATVGLTVLVWVITRPLAPAVPSAGPTPLPARLRQFFVQPDVITGLILVGIVLLLALTRELGPLCCYLTPARPPTLLNVLGASLGLVLVIGLSAYALTRAAIAQKQAPIANVLVLLFILLFIVLKTEVLAQVTAGWVRAASGLDVSLATATDWRWLGFSYLAFRLMHVLRDRAAGRLPALSLQEFVSYALFFPAFTAGPIDRAERFIKDLRKPAALTPEELTLSSQRVLWGVFKKFVLADSLALFALNGQNAAQTTSALWAWVLLYAYAFRLYLDFSGYSDIAIGLARALGVRLPENFDKPYTRQNLTLFWNSWHMTLSQWFRAYVFNPLTRTLRSVERPRPLPIALIIFITQMVVMVLIGLWHGVTWNFVIWGVWHGVGLFIHNRWADFTKPHATLLDDRPWLKRAAQWLGVFLTFHYVALGWVWFALPSVDVAIRVMKLLVTGY